MTRCRLRSRFYASVAIAYVGLAFWFGRGGTAWWAVLLTLGVAAFNGWVALYWWRRDLNVPDIGSTLVLRRAKFVHGTLDGQHRTIPLHGLGDDWPEDYQVVYTNERYTHEGEGVYVLDDIAKELRD